MIKRNKILSFLFISAMVLTSFGKINVSANGGMNFGTGFNPTRTTYRPQQGYINEGYWDQNPEFPGNNSNAEYQRYQSSVKNEKQTYYGLTVYYYYPQGYSDIKKAVPENNYAKWSVGLFRARSSYGENYNNSKWTMFPNKYNVKQSTNANIWRYLGYSMDGTPVENPFFYPDVAGPSNLGTAKPIAANFYRAYTPAYTQEFIKDSSADTDKVIKGKYDHTTFKLNKIEALDRLIAFGGDSAGLKGATVKRYDSRYGIVDWKISSDAATAAEQWSEIVSLTSHPDYESPLFKGWNHSYYATAMAPESPKLSKYADVGVSAITVKDGNGNTVGYGSRSNTGAWSYSQYSAIKPNNTYSIEYEVTNYGQASTTISPVKLTTGIAENNNVSGNSPSNFYPNNTSNLNSTLSKSVTIANGETVIFQRTIKTSANIRSGFEVTAYIPSSMQNDNPITTNDTGHVIFNNVELSDMEVKDISFVDKNGNTTANIVPGEEYKIKFVYQYNGPTLDKNSGYWLYDKKLNKNTWIDTSDPSINLYFDAKVERFYPKDKTSDSKKYNFKETGIWPYNGQKFTYYTDYIMFEQPKVNVTANISANSTWINSNSDNDSLVRSYNDVYNYKIENLKVLNGTVYPLKNGNVNVGISYDIVLEQPSHNTKGFAIQTEIDLNGTKVYTVNQVYGNRTSVTKNVTMSVSSLSSGTKNYPITVKVNSNKGMWEKDLSTQTDNSQKTNLVVSAPKSPSTIFNMAGNGGQSWNVTHNSLTFNGYAKYYKSFNNVNYSFFDYSSNSISSQNKDYSDSYNIDSILFKSKYTTDKGYGTSGWVDLLNANQKKYAKIKAGYGYELQIVVSYKTQALANQPSDYRNNSGTVLSGKQTTNLNTQANINNDIYVKTSDGKILSATGFGGTTQAFDSTVVSSSSTETKIKYTMKTKYVNGKTVPNQILIGENVKDGTYSLNVATPLSNGISNPSLSRGNILAKSSAEFIVQGSMFDDTVDSVVQ